MSSSSTKGPERSGPGNLVIALAAALVVALAACAWLLVDNRQKADSAAEARGQARQAQTEKDASRDAIAAAQTFVAAATSYSYEQGKHEFEWIDEIQDQQVRERLEKNVAALKNAIEVSKTSAKGEAVQAAGRVVSAEQVEVLIAYSQVITDDTGEVSGRDGSILLTMRLVGAEWKVDKLEFLNEVGS